MTKLTRRYIAALLLAALQGAPGTILAQTTPSLAECAAIAADRERLACYDRTAGRAATSSPPALEPSAGKPEPASATAASATGSLIDAAWEFDPASPRYMVRLYEPNYFLFARHTDNVNNTPFSPGFQSAGQQESLDSTEAKYQISIKARLWTTDDRRWGAWFGYTQQSQWQIYNGALSRPFRETDYMPELFVSYRPGIELNGFQWRLLNFGFNHQSNGRSDSMSRSWNRLYAEFGVERNDLVLLAKAWYHVKEGTNSDDNPDITDYYGDCSLSATYKWRDNSCSLMGRGNVSTGKGAAQFTWTSPRFLGPLRAYVQAFTGYGESLIDYNWSQNTIGVGVTLNDAF